MNRLSLFGFLFLLVASVFGACAFQQITLVRSNLLMGHVPVNITLQFPSSQKKKALEVTEEAYALAQSIEKKISAYQPDSEVSCLNQKAGDGFCTLSSETEKLLKFGLEISDQTDHAFDLRFASLSKEGSHGKILIGKNRGKLAHPQTRIGVGSIGKGLIIDSMINLIQSQGFDKALVDAGGDLRALGGPWKVAIQKPGAAFGEFVQTFEITNLALATSGNDEQPGHILDPRTGEKVIRNSSVTVMAKTHTFANALSTAFYVMGEKESTFYLKKFRGIQMIWAYPDGTVHSYFSTP